MASPRDRTLHVSSAPSRALFSASALLALACSEKREVPAPSIGGQSGDEGTSQYARLAGQGNQACDFDESVFDPLAPTTFGVGIEELVATFASSAPLAFHWNDYHSWEGTFTYAPGPSATTLEVQLSRDEERPIYELRNEPFEGQQGFGLCDEVFYEVPVTLGMSTADGALDELVRVLSPDLPARIGAGGLVLPSSAAVPIVMMVYSPHTAYLQHRFDLTRLGGDFELMSGDATWNGGSLDANVNLYPGGSTGRLELSLSGVRRTAPAPEPTCGSIVDPCTTSIPAAADGDATEPFTPGRTRYVGTWPSALSCNNGMSPLPPDTPLIGSSALDVTELVARAPALTRDGATTAATLSLDFDALPAELCQGRTSNALLFNAGARLRESGLEYDLALPLQVIARLDVAGELDTIAVSRRNWEQPMSGERLRAIGIDPPGAADFADLYLQLTVRYTRAAMEWVGAAELRIHGRNPDPECLAAEAASRTAAAPYAGPGCGRSDTVMSESGTIPTGTPLLHHIWSASD